MTTQKPQAFNVLTQPLLGFHAIEASAGTGKTYSITLLWLRLLIERRQRVDQILVTTFTRAATAELQERLLAGLRRALRAVKEPGLSLACAEASIVEGALKWLSRDVLTKDLETALSCFDLAPICTIHGFCQSLISRHSLELACDPGMRLVGSADALLDEIVDDQLMRDANRILLDRTNARQVAKLAVDNPIARILDPVARDEVLRDSKALLAPFLDEIDRLQIPARSRDPIVRKIITTRDSGIVDPFSDTQAKYLKAILEPLNRTLGEVADLHQALDAASLHPMAALARDLFPIRKAQAHVRTFDDVLTTVYHALATTQMESELARVIRERFRAAIVDECQDSDAIQIEVFQRLFAKTESFLVIGDPKQSIYRFRGADLSSYQRLLASARRSSEMMVNYRSDRPLVDALNRLYSPHPEFRSESSVAPIRYIPIEAASEHSRIADPGLNEPLVLLWSEQTSRNFAKRDLARQTADEFRRLLNGGVTLVDRNTNVTRALRASDLAVLATTHRDLGIVRRELQTLGIPCELAGASLGSVWESDEAADLQVWLEVLVSLQQHDNPLASMLSLAATPLLAWQPVDLEKLRLDPQAQASLSERLLEEQEQLHYLGPLPLLQRYWTDLDCIRANLGSRDGERRITNWRQLGCLLQMQWAAGTRPANDLKVWFARQRATAAAGDSDGAEAEMMKLETDLPAVQLVTIFGSKGLEYPIVSCPFLWQVRSQISRRNAAAAVVRHPEGTLIDIGSSRFCEHLDAAIRQQDDEQQRLLYVALTRARHRTYVGLAPVEPTSRHENGAEQSAVVGLLGLSNFERDRWPEKSPIPVLARTPESQAVATKGSHVDADPNLGMAPRVELQRRRLTRCSSYSALTRNEEVTPKDHDPVDRADTKRQPGLLGDLNLSGNRLGQRMHGLLESIIGNGRTLDSIAENLEPSWRTALEVIVSTPLGFASETITLAQLQARALVEMHILLPVETVTPARLSEALLADPLILVAPERRNWAASIAQFGFGALSGFFQGYIDLIFEHDKRYYVVDYKTNALPNYDPSGLEAAMIEHHYLLQARLYSVALHRHLKATLPGYEPEKHLGGCAYLFLRGFPTQGIWFERTCCSGLTALDALFAEPSG